MEVGSPLLWSDLRSCCCPFCLSSDSNAVTKDTQATKQDRLQPMLELTGWCLPPGNASSGCASWSGSLACGNLGLHYVQLDLAQLVYTTTPLFTLALSRGLRGTCHHPLQYAAMGPICLGASVSLLSEVHFSRPGCCFLLAATCLRALKSIQQSTLLQDEKLDSITLLCLMSLPSFCILFLAALVLEVGPAWDGSLQYDSALWACILLSCLGSVLYNLTSFYVISLTSALTIHVLGNFNVVGNLVLSWLLFGSHLSGVSYIGIGLTLVGMFMYHNCDLIAGYWHAREYEECLG
ncbi:solute carrier family 35 member E4 [Alligator mississippiensis]|uniref:Solute carrier family 35 member E4 n=1 Tax=Alligator mississippiensis TaxID=8496 RepID=A0A151N4W6_ALLMI|nr:solute carrier family 35 member E4 [Alligator mississippiensis]